LTLDFLARRKRALFLVFIAVPDYFFLASLRLTYSSA
jgi:hypothetical protein